MINLQDVYESIKDRKEFVTKETDSTICFDYIIIMDDSFSDSKYGWIRRNLRGITFNKKTNELLSLPFHKFFNVNQNEECQYNDLKNKNAQVYEKLDGTMIHCFLLENKLIASTCRSFENIQSHDALAFIEKNPVFKDLIVRSILDGLTPIFEWVSPVNQIVIHYAEPRLVYLMSRNRSTGLYVFEEKYEDKAKKYDIDFKKIMDYVAETGIEGYVCHLDDGNIVKVKTPWYLQRHRSVDLLTKPKYKVYEVVLDGYVDDILSLAPENHRKILQEIKHEVEFDMLKFKSDLENEHECILNSLDNSDLEIRKNYVLEAKKSKNFSGLMQVFSGKNCDSYVKKMLMEKYTSLYPMRIIS